MPASAHTPNPTNARLSISNRVESRRLLQARLFQEVAAIPGLDVDARDRAVARQRERHARSGRPEAPDPAIEIRESCDALTGDIGDDIAESNARVVSRSVLREPVHDQMACDFGRVHAEPRT